MNVYLVWGCFCRGYAHCTVCMRVCVCECIYVCVCVCWKGVVLQVFDHADPLYCMNESSSCRMWLLERPLCCEPEARGFPSLPSSHRYSQCLLTQNFSEERKNKQNSRIKAVKFWTWLTLSATLSVSATRAYFLLNWHFEIDNWVVAGNFGD